MDSDAAGVHLSRRGRLCCCCSLRGSTASPRWSAVNSSPSTISTAGAPLRRRPEDTHRQLLGCVRIMNVNAFAFYMFASLVHVCLGVSEGPSQEHCGIVCSVASRVARKT